MSPAKKTAFYILDIFCMELVSSLNNSTCIYSRNLFSLSSVISRPCSVRHRPAEGPLNSTSPISFPQEQTSVLQNSIGLPSFCQARSALRPKGHSVQTHSFGAKVASRHWQGRLSLLSLLFLMAILQIIQSDQLWRRQSIVEGEVVQMFTNSKAARTTQISSKNSLPAFIWMQARCTLKTLKSRQATNPTMNTTTLNAKERPSSKFNGTPSNKGLKLTLNSQTFFMSRSEHVSSSASTVESTASFSNWCLVSYDSLYLSAALSEGGSSCFGLARRSIFFLMSRTVSRVTIAANDANHRSMMALWQFCSVLFAINSNG